MDSGWSDGEEDDAGDDWQQNMVYVHAGSFKSCTDKVAERRNANRPDKSTDDIECQKAIVVHFTGASNDRRKCTDNRHEASDDDSFAAMFLVKFLGFLDVTLLEYARIGLFEDVRSGFTSEPVANSIASDCSDEEQDEEEPERYRHIARQDVRMVQHAGSKEQAVTWQEKADKQARLGKNNKNNCEDAEPDNQVDEVKTWDGGECCEL